MSDRPPRNIILLSDGTGNSSISPHKTNVWRLYQALDIETGADRRAQQVAFYDDGVGTHGIKLLQLLGGAFGWGLSRNVRELYENLCRHYEPGDRIYIFGFSRGGFTARLLAHFISSCGILDHNKPVQGNPSYQMDTDRGLRMGVKRAYKSYRRSYWQRASLWLRIVSAVPRWLRNHVSRWEVLPPHEFRTRFSHNQDVSDSKLVEFVGVWDTVDAVGLPINILSTAVDCSIYPYKFADCDLSDDVARGRQALAIDDERDAFHPLLWNEEANGNRNSPPDIQQVWFVGMHANVGGGYPEDDLAHISLAWMIGEVRQTTDRIGLLFDDVALAEIRKRASALGKMHDSRRGVRSYYRYKPRNINDISNRKGRIWKVEVARHKIHHTVLDRIADTRAGYAPTGLPEHFDIIDSNGMPRLISPGDQYYESEQQRCRRNHMLQRSSYHIGWRQIAYNYILFFLIVMFLIPFFNHQIVGLEINDFLSRVYATIFGSFFVFTTLVNVSPFPIPDPFQWIIDRIGNWMVAWMYTPYLFTTCLLGVILFYIWRNRIRSNIQELSEDGWRHFKRRSTMVPRRPIGAFEATMKWYLGFRPRIWVRNTFKHVVMPVGFFASCIFIVLGSLYRFSVHYPAVIDGACVLLQNDVPSTYEPTGKALKLDEAAPSLVFETSDPCFETSYVLEKGQRYRINVQIKGNEKWKDLTVPASYDGFENGLTNFHPRFVLTIPTRRHLTLPWFILVGEIGKDSGNIFPINQQAPVFTSPAAGRLYLYVNDAVNAGGLRVPQEKGNVFLLYLNDLANRLGFELPLSKGQLPRTRTDAVAAYKNNIGSAFVTVSRLPSR